MISKQEGNNPLALIIILSNRTVTGVLMIAILKSIISIMKVKYFKSSY